MRSDTGRDLTDERDTRSSLARELADLARTMQSEEDAAALLTLITRAARDDIPGATDASITLVERNRVTTPVTTSDRARAVDELQYTLQEGPCLAALRQQVIVRVDAMADEQRWPTFASRAAELGVSSMLAFQLFVDGDVLGALNLHAATPHAFDEQAETIGFLLASHAAIALAATLDKSNLRTALASRDVIGQAKGILMERFKVTADQAFELLVMTSQKTHRKLRDVADELTTSGQLPARPQ